MNEINDTFLELRLQAQTYIDDILKIFTDDLDKSAREYKAIERNSETSNAKLLLQLMLIYAASNFSMRLIAACGYLMGFVNVSDEAWRQKFLKCSAWIFFLLQNSLNTLAPTALAFNHDGQDMQVYLIDATTFKQVGKKGIELRTHMCYNLTKGAMEEVVVTDNHIAESTKRFTVKHGNLYIGDAVYGSGINLEYISTLNGYVLFRVSPNLVRLTSDFEGKKVIDMSAKLKTVNKCININCYIHTQKGRYLPVRIMASRLPEDKALLAKERKIRAAQKKQTQIKETTLEYCQWVILMTNLDSNHSAKSLFHLYRSRWQIELLFKRIKQFLGVKRIRKASLEHSKLLVMLWILIWSAVEREALKAEIQLIEQCEELERYSPWVMTELIFNQFVTMLNALWAFSYDNALHLADIYRFLRNHKDTRRNQYADYRFSCLLNPAVQHQRPLSLYTAPRMY